MQRMHIAAGHSASAGRSRLLIPIEEQLHSAVCLILMAGLVAFHHAPGDTQHSNLLLDELLSAAARKGHCQAKVLRSLMRRPIWTGQITKLAQEVISILGGAGPFFDTVDLIMAAPVGTAQ